MTQTERMQRHEEIRATNHRRFLAGLPKARPEPARPGPSLDLGAIEIGDEVFVRDHWWRVLDRHHSFGHLRVRHVDERVTGTRVLLLVNVEDVRRGDAS